MTIASPAFRRQQRGIPDARIARLGTID